MGFDFCLLPGTARTNHIRYNQVLARGWAHVGAGGWTWLVEADRFGDFPSLPLNSVNLNLSRRLQTSLRHQMSLDSLLLTSIPTYITFYSRLSSFLRSPYSHLIYKLSVLQVGLRVIVISPDRGFSSNHRLLIYYLSTPYLTYLSLQP